jgi:LuxR family maltose regulon positive regulatory protein
VECLARAAEFPITLIAAPAGFGKSIALGQFLQTQQHPVRTFELSDEQRAREPFARALAESLLGEAPAGDLDAGRLAELLRDVPAVAVDGLHHADDPTLWAFLTELIERTCERTRWILVTRSALDLPVATWLARDLVDLPVDSAALRFTFAETEHATRQSRIPASSDDLGALLEVTGGWPALLAIAARAYAKDEPGQGFPLARDLIDGYLREQIVKPLDDAERAFLFRTCVSPLVDPGAPAAGDGDGEQDLLERVRRRGVPLYPDARGTYRYDRIFRAHLARELRAHRGGTIGSALSSSAAALEQAGRLPEALEAFAHAGAAGDLVRIVEGHGLVLLEGGSLDALATALANIPEAQQFGSAAVLAVKATLAAQLGDYARADVWFEKALALAGDGALKAELALRYSLEQLKQGRAESIERLRGLSQTPALGAELLARVNAALASALVTLDDAPEQAEGYLNRALELSAAARDDRTRARVLLSAALVFRRRRAFERASEYALQAATLAHDGGFAEPCRDAWNILFELARLNDDPANASWYLRRIIASANPSGALAAQLAAAANLLLIETENGDDAAIAEAENRLRERGRDSASGLPPAETVSRAWRSAWHGNFRLAAQLVEWVAEIPHGDERLRRLAELALFSAAAGERNRSREAARRALKEAEDVRAAGTPSVTSRVAEIFCALGFVLCGSENPALEIIRRIEAEAPSLSPRALALLLAVRAFAARAEGQANDREMNGALEDLRRLRFGGAARLLEALPLPALAVDRRFEALTAAEREILKAIASGATSKEIAAATGRSAQTIDAHVKSIVRKLGCRGRVEAVALAHSSGFLG